MEYVLAFVAGLSFLFVWAGLTRPRRMRRPQRAEAEERRRLRALRPARLGFLAAAVEDLAAWLEGRDTEAGWRGGLNARYLRLLKQADWYWAGGEVCAPAREVPYWSLETMWAAKVLHAVLFGLGGLILAGAAAAVFRWSPALALVGLGAGAVGFFDPDGEVAQAAERRRRQIVLEMGYKVPELRAYVRSGRTFVSALRYLTDRPGGPFVKEMYRALQVYDVTADVGRGLEAVMERNALCEPLVNLCGDLQAVIEEGGEVGVVLEAHADAAMHEQRRQLRQQGQDNTQQMSYVVAATTLIVIFLLVGGPALWMVVTGLAGL